MIRVSVANICGSDLHFWRGGAAQISGGRLDLRARDDRPWPRLGSKVKTDSLGRPLREGDRVAYTYFCHRRCCACLNNEPAACPSKIERPLGQRLPASARAFADHYLRPGGYLFAVPAGRLGRSGGA